jgi:mono/diheme cytochrome c family protein
MWVALPELFPDHLADGRAGRGYESFGLVYEAGRDARFDLPIGMSMRRVQGIDRVYFTCSICHTGTVRDGANSPRRVVLGMPSNTVNFGAVATFLQESTADARFEPAGVMAGIARVTELRDREYRGNAAYRPEPLGWIDRVLFRYAGVAMFRSRLSDLLGRLSFLDMTSWGPGRVDTFGPPKALLGFRMDTAPARELVGVVDFPSVWHQKARQGMWLHWDGNNCSVDERNLSAGFGTGATPTTLDRDSMLRIADYLWDDVRPPAFPKARIDATLASEGETVYKAMCRTCHGDRDSPFRQLGDGSLVGDVTPIERVGTDRARLDSYTRELALAQGMLYAGYPADEAACRDYVETACQAGRSDAEYREWRSRCYPARFQHFRKTWGYANSPLDGLWLRAPYLHNGSVPNLRALLEPGARRPVTFYIGHDVYDFDNVGFVTSGPDAQRGGWAFDTRVIGNGNGGHEGKAFGTELPRHLKDALLEYLKTL